MLEAARVGPLVRPLKDDAIGDIARVLWVLMATVGIVLFIACANVANLLLVRVEARQRELAVRSALGAGWGRLAGELLLESAILGVAGGAIGIALAYGALQLLTRLNANLPRLSEIGLDLPVLLFAAAVSLLSGLLFGLAPVFKYAGPRLDLALRSGGRSGTAGRERHHTRNLLVVTQVAMALVLLVGAGLMIRTLLALQDVDPGFRNPDEVLMLRVSIPEASIADPKQVAQTYKNMAERIAAIPGVQTVALTNSATLDFSNNNDPIFPEGRADYDNKLPPIRRFKHLGPGYFATMGKRLVAGRDFTWTDVFEMRNVVILSESLARELYGQPASALGRRVRERPGAVWREVIGVAAQERDDGVNRPAPTIVYWPLLKGTFWVDKVSVFRSMVFVVRSPRTGTQVFLGEVRQAVWAVNAALPVSSVRTLRESYDRSMARTSFTLVMLALSAGMALFLGVIGIYGVISYSVAQRTKEIGIRIALGAQQSAVRQLFLGQGMLLAGIGVAIGLAGAVVLSRYLSALLYGVPPLDALTYASVAALLIAVALLATYVPASRAASVEPMTSLRAE
jgi:predicted permease